MSALSYTASIFTMRLLSIVSMVSKKGICRPHSVDEGISIVNSILWLIEIKWEWNLSMSCFCKHELESPT